MNFPQTIFPKSALSRMIEHSVTFLEVQNSQLYTPGNVVKTFDFEVYCSIFILLYEISKKQVSMPRIYHNHTQQINPQLLETLTVTRHQKDNYM